MAAALSAAALILAAAIGWLVRERFRAFAASQEAAERQIAALRLRLYVSAIQLAAEHVRLGHFSRAQEALNDCPPEDQPADQRPWEWRYLARRCQLAAAAVANSRVLQYQGHAIGELAFSPDSRSLATRTQDEIRVWKVSARQSILLQPPSATIGAGLAFLDRETILSGSADKVLTWNAGSGQARPNPPFKIGPRSEGDLRNIAVSPGGGRIATLTGAYRITIWESATGQSLAVRQVEGNRINCLAISGNGNVATGGERGVIRIWGLESGMPMTCSGLRRTVQAVAFAPDGFLVAAVDAEGNLMVWNGITGAKLFGQPAHDGPANSVAWSADGRTLATVGRDGATRLWNAATGQGILEVDRGSKPILAVAFSPDGNYMATGSQDGVVWLWDGRLGPAGPRIASRSDNS